MGKVVAIDWDGTMFQWADYPNMGQPVPYAIEMVKRLIASGHKIVFWTVRDVHQPIKQKLIDYGLDGHHSISINFRDGQLAYSSSPKVDADLYIDDKALGCPLVRVGGQVYVDWYHVEHLLEEKGYFNQIILGA